MSAQVACPQCGHTYRITYPSGGIVVISLDSFEKMTQRICPIMFGGLCIGTVYWFGITFGAVTIMQVSLIQSPINPIILQGQLSIPDCRRGERPDPSGENRPNLSYIRPASCANWIGPGPDDPLGRTGEYCLVSIKRDP